MPSQPAVEVSESVPVVAKTPTVQSKEDAEEKSGSTSTQMPSQPAIEVSQGVPVPGKTPTVQTQQDNAESSDFKDDSYWDDL